MFRNPPDALATLERVNSILELRKVPSKAKSQAHNPKSHERNHASAVIINPLKISFIAPSNPRGDSTLTQQRNNSAIGFKPLHQEKSFTRNAQTKPLVQYSTNLYTNHYSSAHGNQPTEQKIQPLQFRQSYAPTPVLHMDLPQSQEIKFASFKQMTLDKIVQAMPTNPLGTNKDYMRYDSNVSFKSKQGKKQKLSLMSKRPSLRKIIDFDTVEMDSRQLGKENDGGQRIVKNIQLNSQKWSEARGLRPQEMKMRRIY